jgi:hypothetical protein
MPRANFVPRASLLAYPSHCFHSTRIEIVHPTNGGLSCFAVGGIHFCASLLYGPCFVLACLSFSVGADFVSSTILSESGRCRRHDDWCGLLRVGLWLRWMTTQSSIDYDPASLLNTLCSSTPLCFGILRSPETRISRIIVNNNSNNTGKLSRQIVLQLNLFVFI